MSALSFLAVALAACLVLCSLALVGGVLWLVWRILRLVFVLVGRVLRLVRSVLVDALHGVGALVTAAATVPLALVNLVILRLPSARHYGRAFLDEMKGVGVAVWRVALANPLRFLGLGAVAERVEQHLPDVLERAPRPRRARRATFDGYDVIGTLPSGGSGAQLFVARPRPATQRRFVVAGRPLPSEVVIKSFALESGSTLPQIVREGRALEAASRLGLVCEHQLSDDHFYYVMPYVKGEDLERVTRALHARATPEGLADTELGHVLGYAIDLLDELERFHAGGLWHKDVKPSNVIVAKGRAHLVDFGLVTPLASAMTLTTHGTEYYRDPEMVRLAMQGVRVHEVDGVRFDVYSAGAVLYSMLEGSFPAHGSLSRLSQRCPDALRWIVQRAMADLGSRYPTASAMRADLAVLAGARDPFSVRPAELPSFREGAEVRPEAAPAPAAPWRALPRPEPVPAFTPEPARRHRHRPLALVAMGCACLFVACNATLLMGRRSHAHRLATVEPARPVRVSTAEDRRALRQAERAVEELAVPRSPVPVAPPTLDAAHDAAYDAGGASARPEGELPALPPRARVLVLDDLATGVEARQMAEVRTRLTQRGFGVVGQESDEAAAAGAVELLAGARRALGLGRAEEPETQANLQAFLDRSEGLDALILVSRASGESEHLYRVFLRGGGGPDAH